jgi:hypothetical protein
MPSTAYGSPAVTADRSLDRPSFAYSNLVIDQPEIGTDGAAVISCTVRNTGARALDTPAETFTQ